jgi:GTPase SAR1 family protein
MLSSNSAPLNFLVRLFTNKKAAAKQREVRMCVLGLDNAGKTTILKALSREEI